MNYRARFVFAAWLASVGVGPVAWGQKPADVPNVQADPASDSGMVLAGSGSALKSRPGWDFLPSRDGFAFVNHFEGTPPLPKALRDERTTVGAIAKLIAVAAGGNSADAAYGLCGGMSAAAADYYLSDTARPPADAVPERGSPLFEYLVQRQTDSLGVAAFMAVKFAEWMALPDAADDWGGVEGRTGLELPGIIERLEKGELVPLGLVYRRAGEGALWDNHQVLAYACVRDNGRAVRVRIYDPNWPADDAAELKVTLSAPLDETAEVGASPKPVNRATTRQLGSRKRERPVRGFFAMPYTAKAEMPPMEAPPAAEPMMNP